MSPGEHVSGRVAVPAHLRHEREQQQRGHHRHRGHVAIQLPPARLRPPQPVHQLLGRNRDGILKILKVSSMDYVSSDKKKIPLHITTSKARNQKHRWLMLSTFLIIHLLSRETKSFHPVKGRISVGQQQRLEIIDYIESCFPAFRVNKLFYCYLLSRYFEYFVEK